MFSIIASVIVTGALVLTGMWAHIGAFDTLKNKVDVLSVQRSEPRFGLSTYVPVQGGTGTSTSPVAGDILMSFASNVYGPTALIAGSNITLSTSTYRQLSISASLTQTDAVSTSTNETAGRLSYWTTTSGSPARLGEVATGTVSGTNGITVTAERSAVGGALAIDCTVASGSAAGCLSTADWNIFNNSADFAFPWTPNNPNGQAGNATSSLL